MTVLSINWHKNFINTNGINLHYLSEGEGPLMLMLHGFPEFWYSWRHQIPEFAKDYKVVALDLRRYWEKLQVPTLRIWGENDRFLGQELTYGTEDYVEDFQSYSSGGLSAPAS